jgi:hypothetical protein
MPMNSAGTRAISCGSNDAWPAIRAVTHAAAAGATTQGEFRRAPHALRRQTLKDPHRVALKCQGTSGQISEPHTGLYALGFRLWHSGRQAIVPHRQVRA